MNLLVLLHIVAGTLAISAGFAAPFTKKGRKAHKVLGLVFFASILVLGLSGALVAWVREVPLSFLNGLLISYFVVTSYIVIKKKPNTINALDKCMAAVAGVLVSGFAFYAWQAANTPGGQLGGFGSPAFIVFGIVTLLALVGDIRFIFNNGLAGKQRILRHLWRMFFSLFMSTAAFFLGQAKLFPEALQKIELLLIPVAFVILNMLIWIAIVSTGKRYAIHSRT